MHANREAIMESSALSRSIDIGGRRAPNRFAALPTEGNNAEDDGSPSRITIDRYRSLAEGKAGIVYVEATAVHPDGRVRRNQLRIGADTAKGFGELVREFKEKNPEALFMLQLDHGGALADPAFAKPVAVWQRPGQSLPLLSDADLVALRGRFLSAATLAIEAGFDGLEIKLAHGFLINDLVRPANRRPGPYGGSFQNRCRFAFELIDAVREGMKGKKLVLGARISAYEGTPGGFGSSGPEEVIENLEEPVRFTREAAKHGLDLISVSAGSASANLEILMPSKRYPEGVYRHFSRAKRVKESGGLPTVGAGYSYLREGVNDLPWPEQEKKSLLYWAEKNVREGDTDLVGLGRQAIADPLTPAKALRGDARSIDWCTTCSGCGALLGDQKKVGCIIYDKRYR
jgi:2,4-dienoyl-CoA reductase-like NADH-dependent reductase (Old Yellow Enzyme family)